MNESIISLCYAGNDNGKTLELCRIADFVDGHFTPYLVNRELEFYADQRDLIYESLNTLNAEPGSIAVYEWKVYLNDNGKWWTEARKSDVDWIEVISSGQDTPENLVDIIKQGWLKSDSYDGKHDLIVCCKAIGDKSKAIYIPAKALVTKEGKVYFSDDVLFLDVGSINKRTDCESCRCRCSPNDMRKYLLRVENWQVSSTVKVLSESDIVDRIIRQMIQQIGKELLTRKERQAVRSALDKLSAPSAVDTVAQALKCTRKDAQKHVDSYLASQKIRLDHDTAIAIMEALIANDSYYVQTLQMKVEEGWKRQNNELFDHAKADLDAVNAALQEKKEQLRKADEALVVKQDQQQICERSAEAAIQLQNDVEKAIQERLMRIQEDRAAALVEAAWALPISAYPTSVSEQTAMRTCKAFSVIAPNILDEIPNKSIPDRLFDSLESWNKLCSDKAISDELTVYLFAAFACKQPLIIAGECATIVADLFARSVSGSGCTKVYISGEASANEIIQTLKDVNHEFVCIVDALDSGYRVARELMALMDDTLFILTTPHTESLLIEPASLFTTVFPVLTDFFYTGEAKIDMPLGNCKDGLRRDVYSSPNKQQLRSIQIEQGKWFPNGFYAPLLKRRCALIQYNVYQLCKDCELGKDIAERTCMRFLFMPLMKCLGKLNVIKDVLSTSGSLDDIQKERLLSFIGISEE